VRIFGIDPGSERTGYGCLETDGSRHRLVVCGALSTKAASSFPDRLLAIHAGLAELLAVHRPDCVAIENIFHARNVRSALKLGHARGVALHAPTEVKRAVVGFGRAEKHQVGEMVKLLLGLDAVPAPHDVSDALAVAICHVHSARSPAIEALTAQKPSTSLRSWRHYRA